jgi:hypothetical protein
LLGEEVSTLRKLTKKGLAIIISFLVIFTFVGIFITEFRGDIRYLTNPIPTPQPVKTSVTVGVAYMPFWGVYPYPKEMGWGDISKHGTFAPILGNYRSDDPYVVDWHIKWAVEHGISLFVIDWGWFGPDSPADRAVRQGFMRAKYLGYINFTFDYFFDRLWIQKEKDPNLNLTAALLQDFDWLVTHYFSSPSFFKVDGKYAVFMVGLYRFPTEISIQLVRDLRKHLARRYQIDLYIIYDGVWPKSSVGFFSRFDRVFDAVFKLGELGFVWEKHNWASGTYSYDEMIELNGETCQEWFSHSRNRGVGFVPSVTPGFNNTLIWKSGINKNLYIIPRSLVGFGKMLRIAKEYIDPTLRIVYLHTWNDFQEGTSIEPTKEYGFAYLDAVLDAVCTNSYYHFAIEM